MALYKLLHIFSAVIWIGGMFFVYVVLRPGIGQLLKLPERMRLWDRVFSRFFIWVWLAAFLLLASGFYMIYLQGGFAVMPRFINLMMASGIAMLLVFAYLFFSVTRLSICWSSKGNGTRQRKCWRPFSGWRRRILPLDCWLW